MNNGSNSVSALEVQELCKTYGEFKLDSVSFALPAGYIMGFVGQNGAGKTTTIRCILNMAVRENGEIKIFGLDNITDELAVKQEIAAVFDEIFFVDTWRVRVVIIVSIAVRVFIIIQKNKNNKK